MIKSRRKLKPMKIKGKVWDPMPRNPVCAPRARIRNERSTYTRPNPVQIESMARQSRVLKSGIRRITYK
jgi:hypothetical protein